MELNNITNTGTWSEQATRLNDNFNKVALGIDTLQSAYQSLSQSAIEAVDTLPQTGEANKIYRLVGTTSYSDYMYNTDDLTTPILMATYNNAIDNTPTANSANLVTSGGVAEALALGAVYDVSANNPTAGSNNDGKWESISALLSDANLNTLIPISVRKGGMSVKFVLSSDNKYVRYRLMSAAWSTTVSNWQGVDDVPTTGSDNLVKSGGVANKLAELESTTSEISKEVIETEEENIVIEDKDGNVVAEITPDRSTFKNLKSNGKEVLTEHQDISGLATKEDVENAKVKEISLENIEDTNSSIIIATDNGMPVTEMQAELTEDEEECQSWVSDEYDEEGHGEKYAKITPKGFSAKKFLDFNNHDISIDKLYEGKEFYTIGDSLSADGRWQAKLSELSGMAFSQEKNTDTTLPLSIGGTTTLKSLDNGCGQLRCRNLLKRKESGENIPIIFIQNFNDRTQYQLASEPEIKNARPFMLDEVLYPISTIFDTENDAKNYWDENFLQIVPHLQPKLGSCVVLNYSNADYTAKVITINSVPSSNGIIHVKINGTLNGNAVYIDNSIEVTPESTIEKIVDAIVNYSYAPHFDRRKNNSNSVILQSNGVFSGAITLDVGSTGVAYNITDTNPYSKKPFFFNGTSLTDWQTKSQWVEEISMTAAFKGMFDFLLHNFMDSMIYLIIMPSQWYASTSAKRANGILDIDAYYLDNDIKSWNEMFDRQKDIAEYYGIPVLDMRKNACICRVNAPEFYSPSNVHPSKDDGKGYKRIGETIYKLI